MGQNKYKRKPPNRIQKDTIYIVCGGDTEKIYFDMFKEKFQSQLSGRKIKIIKNSLDPLKLIKYCIEIREYNKNCLKLWAVFDRDDFNNFDKAIELAQGNNVFCAYSNQAFEVWFINHFQELYTPLHRKKYADLLERLLRKTYEKNNKCLKQIISDLLNVTKIEIAIKNSEYGYKRHIEDKKNRGYSNYESCTTVYRLVKELLKK